MAKNEADVTTQDMFSPVQVETMMLALQTQAKVYQRKINTEPNENIKNIYRASLNDVNNTLAQLIAQKKG